MSLVWKWRANGCAIPYLSIKVFTISVSHSVSNHLFDYYTHEVTESIDICLSVCIYLIVTAPAKVRILYVRGIRCKGWVIDVQYFSKTQRRTTAPWNIIGDSTTHGVIMKVNRRPVQMNSFDEYFHKPAMSVLPRKMFWRHLRLQLHL
jgi:hypothetical protein